MGVLKEGDVRVRMSLSPIGVAEVRALEGHRIQLMGQVVDRDHPFIFGFAGVGVVEDPGGSDLAVGQRVVVTPYGTCGHCAACKAEDETQCENGRSLAGIDTTCQGMMRERLDVPARRALPLPDTIGDEEGCYVSEVATAVHLLRRVGFRRGQSIAVVGCGRHGLLTVQVARAMGASTILGVDPSDRAQAATLAAGADACVADADGHGDYDVAIHCNSYLATIEACCRLTRAQGTVGLLGTPNKDSPDVEIGDFTRLVMERELKLVSSASKGTASFRVAIDLMENGMKLDIPDPKRVCVGDAPRQFMDTLTAWPGGRPCFVDLRCP